MMVMEVMEMAAVQPETLKIVIFEMEALRLQQMCDNTEIIL